MLMDLTVRSGPAERGWPALRGLLVVLLLSAGIRAVGWWWTQRIAPFADELAQLTHAYDLMARGQQHVFWPPLTIWLAAGLMRFVGYDYVALRLVWALLDVVNTGLIVGVCGKLFSPRVGLGAGLLWAVYLGAIARAVYVTSEVPALVAVHFALLCMLSLNGKHPGLVAAASGIGLGVAVLGRGQCLSLLVLFPLLVLFAGFVQAGLRRRLAVVAVMGIAALAVWLPWVIRNRVVGGEWLLLSTNSAYNQARFALADSGARVDNAFIYHPWATPEQVELRKRLFSATPASATAATRPEQAGAPPRPETTPEQEFAGYREQQQRAQRTLTENAGDYVLSVIGGSARFWALETEAQALAGPETRGSTFRRVTLLLMAASNLVYIFAVLIGIVGLVQVESLRTKLLVLAYLLGPMLVSALVISKPRYHVPCVPLLLGLAVWAVLNYRVWRPRLTRARVAVIGICWAALGWVWVAWIIFCVTSRGG
jgi:4-amino-4-deoxy-L-arabinose transferase-like glycosyltransferase